MNKFRVCPRCDERYWFNRRLCDECSFEFSLNPQYTLYWFDTEKYCVRVCPGKTYIVSKATITDAMSKINVQYIIPAVSVEFTKELSPKATDETIEKYLMLL